MSEKKNRNRKVKKEGRSYFRSAQNMSSTPTSLLFIDRSGIPPSLPILGVALKRVPLFNTLQKRSELIKAWTSRALEYSLYNISRSEKWGKKNKIRGL